jgi:hypothetical protein
MELANYNFAAIIHGQAWQLVAAAALVIAAVVGKRILGR